MHTKLMAGGIVAVLLATGLTVIRWSMISDMPVNVKDCGAKGDSTTDDSAAFQACLNKSYTLGGNRKPVYVPAGFYKITQPLFLYDQPGAHGSDHGILYGDGMEATVLQWSGSNTLAVLNIHGAFQTVKDLSIDDLGTGWLAGINYSGAAPARSTAGKISMVHVNCESKPGDGVWADTGQADMLVFDHPYIEGCTSGRGIFTNSGNVLSINIIAATMNTNWIHVFRGPTTNLNIIGGEYDGCGILLWDGAGEAMSMQGVRSEGCKRQYATFSGASSRSLSIRAHSMVSQNQVRTGTIAINAGNTNITYSDVGMCIVGDDILIKDDLGANQNSRTQITTCFTSKAGVMSSPPSTTNAAAVWGLSGSGTCAMTSGAATLTCTGQLNYPVTHGITVAGAGVAGADLNATVNSCSSSTVCTLSANASTTVSTAKVSEQNVAPGQMQTPFYFNGGGTYSISDSIIQTEYDVRVGGGEVKLDSVNFDSASLCNYNPWGNTATFGAGSYVNTYCNAQGTPTRFPDTFQSLVKFGTGLSVTTGGAVVKGGLTISNSSTTGTPISGSFRNTLVWNPGTLAACGAGPCATATNNITVTGAVTGADCQAGVVSPAPLSGYPVQCIVTATNTCGIMLVNQSNVGITFGSATFYCRVNNP